MTNAPTKPGYFLVVRNNAIEQCEPTVARLTEGKAIYFVGSGTPHVPPYAELSDCIEWVPIPNIITINALRELAASDPINCCEEGNCQFCGAYPIYDGPPTNAERMIHKPDCPWLRAQER